jgi:thiopeptide-type bacteriocin biosynthesis protein
MSSTTNSEDFFVIRTPRLPFDRLYKGNLDKQQTRNQILEWLSNDDVIESLYIASPSLLERINTWKQTPDSKQGKKIELALLKYFIRMCSRPTPFGLFSGIHLGTITNSTELLSTPFKLDARKTRLDMFFLSTLKENLQRSNNLKLKFYPNTSLYNIAGQYRYIEAYNSNETRQFRLSAVETDEYFNFIMTIAGEGETINELIDRFIEKYPTSEKEEIEGYVLQLIEESVLVADVPLPITGKSPDLAFLKSIQKIEENSAAELLSSALQSLDGLDKQGYARVDEYKKIYQHLDGLPIDVQENKLFQVDIYQHFDKCNLDEQLYVQLYDKILLIHALSNDHKNPLASFIIQFNERYEGQLVPLNLLLDDESGIGFSNETGYESSLIAGLNLNNEPKGVAQTTEPISPLDSMIMHALSLPENCGGKVVKLESKALKKHADNLKNESNLPASFAALVSLFKDENNAPIIKLNSCYGPSAANLLGRFCHLQEKLSEKVITHLKKEEKLSSDVIFAEVVHLPDGRPGNVIARPKLRKYEIVFMADTDVEDDYQISINDLFAWVEDDQVKLWSKRLQKQVIPRLSSAHNFTSRSLSIYKFLCTVQYQSSFAPNFMPPASFAHAHFTPRILLDNVILHEKTWRIPRSEIIDTFSKDVNKNENIRLLKQKYHLDDYVCFHNSDNVLHLDLNNELMVEILAAETKGQETIELKEALITQYKSPVETLDGECFCNEIIIPFWNAKAKPYQTFNPNISQHVDTQNITRRFAPGSEWMSLKIYSGNTEVENFLIERISPLLDKYVDLYEKWFFIRYADPQWHIRIRFNGEPKELYGELLPKLNELFDPMLVSGELKKVELFTYNREVERYGGPLLISLVEQLFQAESDLVINALKKQSSCGDDLRWRLVGLVTDQLLEIFDYSTDEKLKLISYLRQGFGNEFNETGVLRKKIGNKYQTLKNILINDLENLTQSSSLPQNKTQEIIFPLVHEWKKVVTPYISEIKNLIPNISSFTKNELLSSMLHMTNNRIFKAYGREHELAMHDFMRRYYLYQSKRIRE